MPPHDETARVTPGGGAVRRPPPARARAGSGGSGAGGVRRPPAARARTTAARDGGGRPAARSGGGSGGGRPPAKPPTGGRRPGGSSRPPGGGKKKGAKPKRRRWLKVLAGLFLSMLVLLGVFVGVVYATTEVPTPESVQNDQTTVVYYADGVTEMARLGNENRTNVTLAQISEPAQNAILAAENRAFYTDPGISFTGIVRAAWNNLTGGSTQGGSTITQQYVKNAFLTSDQTFSRKFKELFLAVKLDNEYSKEQILENYLNTIYFGRGAYGIEAAANTYFGVPAAQLTPEQGAVLAVLIRNPSANDPETNPEGAKQRWGPVLDAMVEQGWLDAAAREAAAYPAVLPNTGSSSGIPEGPLGLIVRQVLDELERQPFSYSRDDIYSAGLRITTTVDKAKQDAAVAAVNEVMAGEPQNLQEALVAVDPATGGVLAYYGNALSSSEDPAVDTTDYAQALKPPGSSFKPYTLAAALENGFSVGTRRDGSSPQEFEDRPGLPVVNSGNAQCGNCTLKEAMTRSLNTTYYGLAYEVGPEVVAETAREIAGLPATWDPNQDDPTVPEDLTGFETLSIPTTNTTGGSIGIGEYAVRPIQQAAGFATFAAGGVHHATHFVASVADSAGTVLGTGTTASTQAISPEVANDVTFALTDVAESSELGLDGNRPVAAKTGTQGLDRTDNSDAWMVGYTPSISTAVWIGAKGTEAITNARGNIIYGSGLPGEIWQQFMNTVLEGTPEQPLPSKALIEGNPGRGIPEPTTEAPAPTTSEAPAPEPAPVTRQAPAPSRAPSSSSAPVTSEAPVVEEPVAPTPVTPAPSTTAPSTTAPNG
ncbi:transglycosylase domain-containing protein [Modestobacter sp. VKM Ac-2979]|uniref:transglycosylase domain-containing protein n=1 Tax=unclassified Modestobacter TaxID=2643866 RepID=UPI0022AB9081|nr:MULTISPECIES: transglycosylase domain-containing protein [unclassified Modestobacter]MCZ2810927.1 transglycosylase domain-containing protein [Modestobacter sp. VKM Ac-2979]MCZ2840440.1 transglycosylase domain-containing protein [Modestobacter sp. VKM Ac-2980]